MSELPKRDWKKIVEESNGRSVFVPEKFLEQVKAWSEKRNEFTKRVNEISRGEIEISVMFQTLVLEIRKYFADNGREDIWTADVGIETNALKDGQFIININEPPQR